MQKHTYLFILMILAVLMSCQKPKKKMTVSRYDPAALSFSFLKESIKDVRILALGESSHGFGSMHTLKVNLVKYLHEELGYDVLVIEAGYGDVGLSWYNEDKSTSLQLINTTVAGNLRSAQLLPLFEYMKERKNAGTPLEYRGMDAKVTGFAFRHRLMHVIKRLEPKIIQDSIAKGMMDYARTFEVTDNQEEWQKYMDSYLNAIDFAQSIIEESREDIKELEIVEDEEVDILVHYLDMLEKAANYKFGEVFTRGLFLRDSLMAESVFQFADTEFPKSKIIIWGHNGHIEKSSVEGDDNKWLGHYLKEKYKDKYYALGMFAKKGYIYQTSTKKTSNFDLKDPSFIEVKMYNEYGNNVFLDLPSYDNTNTSWIHKPIFGYELEAGGKVNFVPSKRFDGVLLLGATEPPNYLINPDNPRR